MDARPYRQSVPRPDDWAPGPPPPWAGDPAGAAKRLEFATLRRSFSERGRSFVPPSPIVSAVLVPLYEAGEGTNVVLCRRAATLTRDPGHMAFPGGRLDPGESPEHAALREAEEEIGLLRGAVELISPLGIAERVRDRQVVAPYVAILGARPAFVISDAEVDAVIEVPLTELVREGAGWQEEWRTGERTRRIRFFADPSVLGDDIIWGLTAAILWDLLEFATASP